MPDFDWPAPGWPAKGAKVRFLNKNGYDREREDAAKVFTEGQELTVKRCEVGSWSSTYEFEEHPGKYWNTVMFQWPIRHTVPANPNTDTAGLVEYSAGLLNDFGGGNVDWWMDYIRAELGRAYDFYSEQHADALQAAERRAVLRAQEGEPS